MRVCHPNAKKYHIYGSLYCLFKLLVILSVHFKMESSSLFVTGLSVDIGMKDTYKKLAQRAFDLYHNNKNEPVWISVTGGPGSGKSTLTNAVVSHINSMKNNDNDELAVCIPMDGYHYSKAELLKLNLDISRRGAPWTFDATRLYHDLSHGKSLQSISPETTLSLPNYCRKLSDPVPDQVKVDLQRSKIIFVEGNYLNLGSLMSLSLLEDNGDCPVSLKEEVSRWKPCLELFDQSWFICTESIGVQRQRLIERHLQTWTDEKTQQWGGGTAREAATRRADYNDVKNAVLVNQCKEYADIIIQSK